MKNYMKYFLLMGLVSVASAVEAVGTDEWRVVNMPQEEGDVATPSHWISNPSK